MPLYRVKVTYEAVVEAPNDQVAIRIARSAEVFFDVEKETICTTIFDAEDIPAPWTPNCIPYGGDENTTIRGILKQNERSAEQGV